MSNITPKGEKPIILPDEEPMVTPAWLEARGFIHVPFKASERDALYPHYPANFDVDFTEDDLCYIESEIHRDEFCVVLRPEKYTDGSMYFDFEVYIQDDIGCGFINMPFRWAELSIKTFCLLYEAFRGKKLMLTNILPANSKDF